MNCEKLISNINDQILEAQIKLGFAKETVRLYYPLTSLIFLVEGEKTKEEKVIRMLQEELPSFSFSQKGDRVEICIPSDYVVYVHERVKPSPFLVAFIGLFQEHTHLSLQQIKETFSQYGKYVCLPMSADIGFDYVIYFEDSVIDEYYYCIKFEMDHVNYHRFTKKDYESLL